MIQIKRLLLTTDYSDSSAAAIPYAVSLARQYNSEIHLVHVVEENIYADFSFAGGLANPPIYFENLVKARMEKLEKVADTLPVDIKRDLHLRRGVAASEIVAAAKAIHADLIVIATHGRTGLAHLFLGSVAERVVRESPCPVLTIREKAEGFLTDK